VSDPDPAALVETVGLEISAPVAEAMRSAGARDDRLGAEHVTRAARRAVGAWVMAVNGDGSALADLAQPDAAHWLLHPVWKPWQVAPGPAVTKIEIWDLAADDDPPQLRISFRFTGHQRPAEPGQASGAPAAQKTLFAGMIDLALQETGPWPWQLSSGHVETLDEFLGYTFTSRRETPGEYGERTGSTEPPAAAGPARRFRLTVGFYEHDVRFGATVTVEVRRESAPAREEAVELVWPAVERETARALGEGNWRPALSTLDVVELLGD
jgi:hypothetical protein